ncbi:hypothetical protein ACFSJ3_10850 [Corallincola platygyrae]|uniref:Uncharacterized protein n=1 Tax=Corallincola platygyrae TaxID=1193278 RepID=A0ABW4XR22_9GAMM
MLLDKYEEQALLFNTNFLATSSQPELQAYRGELVIVEGEVADASGRKKPPVTVLRDAILLADDGKQKLMVGGLDSVDQISALLDRYQGDVAEDAIVILMAPNAHTEASFEYQGISGYLLPWDAMVWSQFTDELGLEKSDFKGKSAADKVLTAYREAASYSPKFPAIPMDEILANATSAKRETHGAI